MTSDKARKTAIRQRMTETGEPYSVARRATEAQAQQSGSGETPAAESPEEQYLREAAAAGVPAEDLQLLRARVRARERAGQLRRAVSLARERAGRAQEAADQAQEAADAAEERAELAQEAADETQDWAGPDERRLAEKRAATARRAADLAQEQADQAQEAADRAEEDACEAEDRASGAEDGDDMDEERSGPRAGSWQGILRPPLLPRLAGLLRDVLTPRES